MGLDLILGFLFAVHISLCAGCLVYIVGLFFRMERGEKSVWGISEGGG